uniref:Ig-like domain-containing protein n=2 Tax=Oncorhynchus tshawytscha TaxID=74940 RepID=A0A8C8FZY9_ONCTS
LSCCCCCCLLPHCLVLETSLSTQVSMEAPIPCVGDDVSLPCTNVVHPDCSSTAWLFSRTESHSATEKVFQGKIQNEGNEGSERLGVGSDCSLRVRNIGAEDTGVYVCRQYLTDGRAHLGEDTTVYLSVLTISMSTPETDLKHPRNVTLRCSLLTYGGPVTCDSFVRDIVRVSWVNETGGELQGDSRYQVTRVSGCDITLTVKLWRKDKNRKWWCQLTEGTRKTFVYLTSKVSGGTMDPVGTIITAPQQPIDGQSPPKPHSGTNNINELPISRIVLCVALPLMVIVYAVYTTRRNRLLAEVSSVIEL